MWLLFTLLFINYANGCQERIFADKNITKDEIQLLLNYINERTKKAHTTRINKTLHSTLQTIHVVQQKQAALDQLKKVSPIWLEKNIDNRLEALLKGIAGALIEAQCVEEPQFYDRRPKSMSDYTMYLILMNEWRRLHLLFHISKDTLKNTNQRIIAFEALKPKLYKFFNDNQSISEDLLAGFTRTYEDYVRELQKLKNRKIEIQNRIGLYLFLLNQQGLSKEKIWKTSTLDEIMRSFMSLLDLPLFENIFAPIIYDENGSFYKFIEKLATVKYVR